MDKLFKEESQRIRVYLSFETIADPYEKNVDKTPQKPRIISAMVTDLVSTQLEWKMPGVQTNKAKELMIEKKYRTLIECSEKVEINNEYYYGWRDNAGERVQIREEGDYLKIYIYLKQK